MDAAKLSDYYTNPHYWQEYDCPQCGQDFDVSPIPKPDTKIHCNCGAVWDAGQHEPNTYVYIPDLVEATCVPYPQPQAEEKKKETVDKPGMFDSFFKRRFPFWDKENY